MEKNKNKNLGLYSSQYEHDACGVGFVANVKGEKSHKIIEQAIEVLINLDHRGACGAEKNTGDGAGILVQISHQFFNKVSSNLNFNLPSPKEYGIGMIFFPPEEKQRLDCENTVVEILNEEGLEILGWRDVPTNNVSLGDSAKASQPFVKQVFIKRPENISNDIDFERKLYTARKRCEKFIRFAGIKGDERFYVASMSYKTIVYKGMLTCSQLDEFYPDLKDSDMESAIGVVHSRFSTNTFPSWERAHPNHYVAHNGEINTLRGNVNWMHARQARLESDAFKDDLYKLFPVISPDGSDSAMFDNCLEFLVLSGRSLAHSVMMMIPEPWSKHKSMSPEKRAFYEYHHCIMEPWDGPASVVFTDGIQIGATLDRNGLRPSRYYVTDDDLVVMASEVGVLDIPEEKIIKKGRLEPGKMFLIDMEKGKIISDEEIKQSLSAEFPYQEWLKDNIVKIEDLPMHECKLVESDHFNKTVNQKAFGYTEEDLKVLIEPMARNGVEALGAMGTDTPLAVLSERPKLLFNYFKQLFAQVTNPPIDAIRESIITSTITTIGSEGNLLETTPRNCRQIEMPSPILTNDQLLKLSNIKHERFKSETFPILFNVNDGEVGLKKSLEDLFEKAVESIEAGVNILVLSDRKITDTQAPIPSLLAVSGLHHYLIREGLRSKASIILESGEPRETHHFAMLLGYGVSAINPYLALESIEDMAKEGGLLADLGKEKSVENYVNAGVKGVIKILSKMGISTIKSYRGAQIFEAIGLNSKFVEKYFTWTPTRIEGIGLDVIAEEVKLRFLKAVADKGLPSLDKGGEYFYKKGEEKHVHNPLNVSKLQRACRKNDYNLFKEYSQAIDGENAELFTLRGMMEFDYSSEPIDISEVESVESICRRFKTGAMSYGALSKETHEDLAIAMNRIKGKSNSGEGGEDIVRFEPLENGDSKRSAIKQVASGRFGVTSHYLVNADEIQIKMAQGAKPGEGGQLPGKKVYPWIAKVRLSTPGVGLISPPPHHDIYSIEDLAQLIHDLKNANEKARINVKLVSSVGVGTIAAGVAKGHADVVLISGFDGGTGASPQSSIKHAGMPWEIGLAETHQTLLLNDLRSRIVVETDGQMKTGRDVIVAALLGAEEFGFSTAPLIALGCIMRRVCHLNTCPVGVATQDPKLRAKYKGDPSHAVNFMHFIAQEVREWMAKLGFRTINEMVGRIDKINAKKAINHWKAKDVDLTKMLTNVVEDKNAPMYKVEEQDHGLESSLDKTVLLEKCRPAIDRGEKVSFETGIKNINRVVGTIVGSEVSRKYGSQGLPDGTINILFKGSAGQSFGAFVPKGMNLTLEGDANDYLGKGLSGGNIIVRPPKNTRIVAEENIIAGNVALYGATGGKVFIRGIVGERFCVRNSGVEAVVEGVGDHACEYMTGGRVVVLGQTGRNFAAGMSGGVAYVYDPNNEFEIKCNFEMVGLERIESSDEQNYLQSILEEHSKQTDSSVSQRVLSDWSKEIQNFVKVIPNDYKRMMETIAQVEASGITGDEALMVAFEKNATDLSRVGGN